jgi:hypothetical protein
MTTLYWADPSDPTHTTVGLDLSTDSTSGFQFTGIHWGDIDPDVTWHDSGDVPGAEQIKRHPGPVEGQITLIAGGVAGAFVDYETLLDTYRLLGEFLETEGVLVWQPNGQSYPQYFDTYPSPIPALYRGKEQQGLRIVEALQDEGYTFTVLHHPYPRRDPVTLLNSVPLTSALGDNVATFTNPGSAVSEARLEIEVAGTEWVTQVRAGIKHGDSSEFASGLAGFNITPVAVDNYWRTIDRHVFTPTTPADFAGVYRAVAAVQLAEDVFHFRLDHGSTTDESQPLGSENEIVDFDATDLTNFDPFVELELGLVPYDGTSESLVVEIHAWSEGGTDVGGWGNLYLIPADDGAFRYRSPGFGSGADNGESYKGVMFNLSGGAELDEDDGVILDTDGAIAEARPIAGKTLATGPHILNFRGSAHNRSRTRTKLADVKILKNDVLERRIGIWSQRGRPVVYYGGELHRRIDFRVPNDTDLYRFQVEEVVATSPLRWTKVAALVHRYIPIISGGRKLVVDAGTRQARIEDSAGGRIASLRATGLPYLEPGPGALAILVGEFPTAGYSHVDERGPLPEIDETTEVLVTLVVTPRDLQA